MPMLSTATRITSLVRLRHTFQQSKRNNYGLLSNGSVVSGLMVPFLNIMNITSSNYTLNNTYQNVRPFSSSPPFPPRASPNTTGRGNFRSGGGRGGDGGSNFRLPRPNLSRGGRGRGTSFGRGGAGGVRGRENSDSDIPIGGSRYDTSEFGYGGGGGGGGGGDRNSPPPLNKKNIYGNPSPFITAVKDTRANAMTLFPGDYSDQYEGYSDDEFDDDDNKNEAADDDTTTLYDPSFVPDDPGEMNQRKQLKAELLREQEKREKWIDNALPLERVSIIDERGRSYGRGGRKRAQARVWIQPGLGEIIVNRRRFTDYFDRLYDREQVMAPFVATETCNMFDVQVMVKGGGLTGQAGAIRLGAARALNAYNPDLYRPPLKLLGYLTRDARRVERKKVGHTKARKSPQWVRR